jgi:hypothetical protein
MYTFPDPAKRMTNTVLTKFEVNDEPEDLNLSSTGPTDLSEYISSQDLP